MSVNTLTADNIFTQESRHPPEDSSRRQQNSFPRRAQGLEDGDEQSTPYALLRSTVDFTFTLPTRLCLHPRVLVSRIMQKLFDQFSQKSVERWYLDYSRRNH